MLIEVAGRAEVLDPLMVQRKLEQVPGIARVVAKQEFDSRLVFELETSKGRFVRGDVARAVVESGWDLNELRPAAMSLEEVFLQLTGEDAAKPEETPVEVHA